MLHRHNPGDAPANVKFYGRKPFPHWLMTWCGISTAFVTGEQETINGDLYIHQGGSQETPDVVRDQRCKSHSDAILWMDTCHFSMETVGFVSFSRLKSSTLWRRKITLQVFLIFMPLSICVLDWSRGFIPPTNAKFMALAGYWVFAL